MNANERRLDAQAYIALVRLFAAPSGRGEGRRIREGAAAVCGLWVQGGG